MSAIDAATDVRRSPRGVADRARAPLPTLALGLDIGGTKTACVVTDAEDRLLLHDVVPTDPGRLAGQVVSIARAAVERFAQGGTAGQTIGAIGVAVPGQVDSATGVVGLAVNLGAPQLQLGRLVEQELGLRCFVEHDARAAAAWVHLRARQHSAGDAADDLVYVSIGTGISAGIVIDGRPLRGQNGLTGEIGHLPTTLSGERCACGLDGCLETIAAGPAIARQAHAGVAARRQTTLTSSATASDVFRAAEAGDELAVEIVDRVAGALAVAIRGLVLTLGVRRVVIGGGVAAAGEPLLERIRAVIAGERGRSPLVETAFRDTTLELLPPDLEAGARGAAAIARQRAADTAREGVAER